MPRNLTEQKPAVFGLLWMDDTKEKELTDCVNLVCQAYKRKFGHPPNLIMVHPNLIPIETRCIGIRLMPRQEILLHHYYAIRVPSS